MAIDNPAVATTITPRIRRNRLLIVFPGRD
jgi:hypothetical protein